LLNKPVYTTAHEATKNKNLTSAEVKQLNSFYSNPTKKTLICDVDEILVNITPKWVSEMVKHRDELGKYFDLDEDFDYQRDYAKVLYRPYYMLDHWLLKQDVDQDKVYVPDFNKYIQKMMDLYDTADFYDDLPPTKLALGLAQTLGSTANGKPLVDKLIIISRSSGTKSENSKTRFIQELFAGNMDKVDTYYITGKEQKSDVTLSLNKDELNQIAAVFEDENKNVVDYLQRGKINSTKIYMPSLNYNRPNLEFKNIVKASKSELVRYMYEAS